MPKLVQLLLAISMVCLLIGGCGGDDGEPSPQADPPSTSEADDSMAEAEGVSEESGAEETPGEAGSPEETVPAGPIDGADLPDTYAMDVSDSRFGLAASDDAVWVSNGPADTVSRIDRRTGTVTVVRVGGAPVGLAVGFDAVWVTNRRDDTVSRIDVASYAVTDTIEVGEGPQGIVVGNNAIWVASEGDNSVSRIDAETLTVTDVIGVGEEPEGLAATDDAVWVANSNDRTVSRVDPERRTVTDTITVNGEPRGIAAIAGALWVDSDDGTVVRIDPATPTVTDTVALDGSGDTSVGSSDGDVWVINRWSESLSRIDPDKASVAVTRSLDAVAAVIESRGTVWAVILGVSYNDAFLEGEEPTEPPEGVVRRIDPASLLVSLEGTMLNAADDSPMPGVIVVPCFQAAAWNQCTISTAQTAETGADGTFSVPVAETGRYVILYSLEGAVRPDWDGLEFEFETGGVDDLVALTQFFGDVESLTTPFVIRSLDEEGPTSFGGYFYSGDLELGSVWAESSPISVSVTPAGGFIDLRIWDRASGVEARARLTAAFEEGFQPVVASTDDPGSDDDFDDERPSDTEADVSATEIGARFLDGLLVYAPMRDAVSDDELDCAAQEASERFTSAEIEQLVGAAPPAPLVAEVGQLLDECFSDETMRDVLSAAFVEGADFTEAEADCLARDIVSLPATDLVTLIVVDDASELPGELLDRVVAATQACLGS